MRLLITRPQEDAVAIAQILRALGHTPILAPLMEVQVREGPALTLEGIQGFLATSANGVRALAQRTARRDLPVYAVGPQTAESARSAGFKKVLSAEGDSNALVEFVAERADPREGQLLHAAGAETAGRVKQALHAKGFTVETVVLYDAVPVAKLPENALATLQDGTLGGVLLFSPRSAKTFATLVSEAGVAAACEKLDAYCISAATAAALTPLTFARVAVAGLPNQDAMVALIPPAAPGP
jgi:uroporphyrinogen-III synthase